MQSRIHPATENALSMFNVGAILLIAAIGIGLGFQGWNSRSMNFDHINFIWGAERFLTDGALPDRGDVSSYWVHTTPGTAWLMLPGMFFFKDPRLYELVGSASLYVGTLFGLFLLTRMCFGLRCAYLSVLLYALSRSGLFYAGSLWSIGHPFFYVWMAYFCLLWIERQNSNYLAAAFVTWSAGMYVDMVLAPAMFIFPVLWLIYRPKLRIAPLLLAAATVVVIWYPYLRLEASRNFFDLKSLVLRHRNRPADYKQAWCMPTLVEQPFSERALGNRSGTDAKPISPQTTQIPFQKAEPRAWYANVAAQVRIKAVTVTDGLMFNFDQMAWTPRLALPLLLLGVITLGSIALEAAFSTAVAKKLNWLTWVPRFAWTSILLGALVNEVFVARFLSDDGSLSSASIWRVRAVQAGLLFIGGTMLLLQKRMPELLRRFVTEHNATRDSEQYSRSGRLFALILIVPWVSLVMVVEPGEWDRYWWLWPLELVAVVSAVTYIPERFGWPRVIAWVGQITLTVMLLSHPWLFAPVQAWAKTGWSGPRANDIQAADYLASQIRSEGKAEAAIGYQVFIRGFMAAFHFVDPRYKVGAELDLFLKHRYGISNSNQCGEGVSPQDEYRIVQTAPNSNDLKEFLEYIDVRLDPSFRMLRQFGNYQVFKRIGTSPN